MYIYICIYRTQCYATCRCIAVCRHISSVGTHRRLWLYEYTDIVVRGHISSTCALVDERLLAGTLLYFVWRGIHTHEQAYIEVHVYAQQRHLSQAFFFFSLKRSLKYQP